MLMLREPKSDDRDLLVRLDSVDVPLLPSEPGRKQIIFQVEHEDQEFGNGSFKSQLDSIAVSLSTWMGRRQ